MSFGITEEQIAIRNAVARGLGIAQACLMMETASGSGTGLSGASDIHMNVFGLHPVVVQAEPDLAGQTAAKAPARF